MFLIIDVSAQMSETNHKSKSKHAGSDSEYISLSLVSYMCMYVCSYALYMNSCMYIYNSDKFRFISTKDLARPYLNE